MAKNLKIREVAEKYNRDRSTVQRWIDAGLIPEAVLECTPFGDIWLIPETALKNFVVPEPGRKKKEQKAA